jgi:hypothetical protein
MKKFNPVELWENYALEELMLPEDTVIYRN